MVVTNTLKIMRATMLLSATSNGVGVNVRLEGYGLSVSRYQGIYKNPKRLAKEVSGNVVRTHAYAHPQHTMVVNHPLFVLYIDVGVIFIEPSASTTII